MVWTIVGQDRISGKLETFAIVKDGTDSKKRSFNEASETVEVIAIIQGNHTKSTTLYSPFTGDVGFSIRTEEERVESALFKRCTEYWEGI